MKFIIPGTTNYEVDTSLRTCTCKDFTYRRSTYNYDDPNRLCKHLILANKMAEESNKEIENQSPQNPHKNYISWKEADKIVTKLDQIIKLFTYDILIHEFTGSYRRKTNKVGDIDIILVAANENSIRKFIEYLDKNDKVFKRIRGKEKVFNYIYLEYSIQIDFKFVPMESFVFSVMHYTGSKQENIRLRQRAKTRGMMLNEYELKGYDGIITNERDIYEALGLKYIPPTER